MGFDLSAGSGLSFGQIYGDSSDNWTFKATKLTKPYENSSYAFTEFDDSPISYINNPVMVAESDLGENETIYVSIQLSNSSGSDYGSILRYRTDTTINMDVSDRWTEGDSAEYSTARGLTLAKDQSRKIQALSFSYGYFPDLANDNNNPNVTSLDVYSGTTDLQSTKISVSYNFQLSDKKNFPSKYLSSQANVEALESSFKIELSNGFPGMKYCGGSLKLIPDDYNGQIIAEFTPSQVLKNGVAIPNSEKITKTISSGFLRDPNANRLPSDGILNPSNSNKSSNEIKWWIWVVVGGSILLIILMIALIIIFINKKNKKEAEKSRPLQHRYTQIGPPSTPPYQVPNSKRIIEYPNNHQQPQTNRPGPMHHQKPAQGSRGFPPPAGPQPGRRPPYTPPRR